MKRMKFLLVTLISLLATSTSVMCYAQEGEIVNAKNIYTYTDMQSDIIELCATYPCVSYNTLGKSASGLSIYEVVLGDPNAKHHICVNASIHAREYQNTLLVMDLLEDACIKGWDKDVCIHFVPMVNPDGVAISQSGIDKLWKANGNGVDLNRNFPTGWGYVDPKGYSTVPSREFYCGASEASEPETKAMIKLLTQRKYDCVLSYHQAGQVLYWGVDGMNPAVEALDKSLAITLKNCTGYYMSKCKTANGGMGDYINSALNTPNVTIETGKSAPNPHSSYKTVYNQNKNVLYSVADWCINTYNN